MKVEIINKPMLCWDDNEVDAKEYHVLAKITECDTDYPFKVIYNENTISGHPEYAGWVEAGLVFKHIKPLPENY